MTTPTINVNLTTCHCGPDPYCRHDNAPVLIPLPIPRSVTFHVALGQCTLEHCRAVRPYGAHPYEHSASCPARPVKVSCSISGETWEESEVTDVDNPHDHDGRWGAGSGDSFRFAIAACNERWALVKALVLGQSPLLCLTERDPAYALAAQRNAVYAALAKEWRLEQALCDAQHHSHALMSSIILSESDGLVGRKPERRHSAAFLFAYIDRLIEQVGILGVAP